MNSRQVPILFCLLFTFSKTSFAEWHTQYWNTMGTRVGVELWHTDKTVALSAFKQIHQEMERINQLMSPFIKTSEVSRINRDAAKSPIKISRELASLLSQAQKISILSHGVFDITFASVGYLYDYRKHQYPDKKAIQQHLPAINYQHIQLSVENSEIFFQQPGVRIDLGGIAKGYAVDQAINILQKIGIQHALVSAGGDSRLIGDKKGKPWVTGIRHPRHKDKYVAILPLENTAISTSGDYERYFIKDNIRYHHIIQPETGLSASRNQSVTILGPTTTQTDALSTTMFILSSTDGLKLINSLPDYEAIIIDKHGTLHYSNGLQSAK